MQFIKLDIAMNWIVLDLPISITPIFPVIFNQTYAIHLLAKSYVVTYYLLITPSYG